MANTITTRTLVGGGAEKVLVLLVNILSDGSEETDTVIYDNSAFVNDVSKGNLICVMASGNSCTVRLEWDQTTDSPICSFDPAYTQKLDFRTVGGVNNPRGAGATGDIVLTTANLDAGDEVTLMLVVHQN